MVICAMGYVPWWHSDLRAIRIVAAAVAVAPLVIKRVDKPSERYVVDVSRDHLTVL
jgi:hypothetical protein